MYNNQIRAFMADVKSMMGRGHESRRGMAGSFGGGLSARVSLVGVVMYRYKVM